MDVKEQRNVADQRKDKEATMTTDQTTAKRGRGRPRKEDVEKAQVAAKIAPPKETKIYSGAIYIDPFDPTFAPVMVGTFHYRAKTNDMEISPNGDIAAGWAEFLAAIRVGIYIVTDPATGSEVFFDRTIDKNAWADNIEKASFWTPKGDYSVGQLSYTYEIE